MHAMDVSGKTGKPDERQSIVRHTVKPQHQLMTETSFANFTHQRKKQENGDARNKLPQRPSEQCNIPETPISKYDGKEQD